MTVIQKLAKLRQLMRERKIDIYIIPSSDFHASEYVGDHFKSREYMSGFTGSAGTLVVSADQAFLFTDGRYFLQAESQLEGSTIILKKMYTPGVPDIADFICDIVPEGGIVGFDGRVVSSCFAEKIVRSCAKKGAEICAEDDLVGMIWSERPPLSAEKVMILGEKYTGESARSKLERIRVKVSDAGADFILLSALDEIAWTLNLRGNDVECTPVFLSFMLLSSYGAILYCNPDIFDGDVLAYLKDTGVTVKDYEDIYVDLASLPRGKTVWIDPQYANYMLRRCVPDCVDVINKPCPVELMKAVKNDTEIENIKKAHIKDGVALTRFIYRLKTGAGKDGVSELSAAKMLRSFRESMDGFVSDSFPPIIAYAEHAAIVHYESGESTDVPILRRGFCLCDTGGHYLEGTTDVTRTVALGELTQEEKRIYTLALKGHLDLKSAVFQKGICGENLDILARLPLWSSGLDYAHGTGHGVGCLLSVHEGPQRISWKIKDDSVHYPLEEGMVVSIEPGVYLEGRFGVRHENLVWVRSKEKNQYGEFLNFEDLTLVPFDNDAVDLSLLTREEIGLLNAYHARVYKELSPYFEGEELEWLGRAVKPL